MQLIWSEYGEWDTPLNIIRADVESRGDCINPSYYSQSAVHKAYVGATGTVCCVAVYKMDERYMDHRRSQAGHENVCLPLRYVHVAIKLPSPDTVAPSGSQPVDRLAGRGIESVVAPQRYIVASTCPPACVGVMVRVMVTHTGGTLLPHHPFR